MKNRWFAAALALAVLACLAGCSQRGTENRPMPAAVSQPPATVQPAAATPSPPPAPPEWSTELSKGIGLIGKGKQPLVDAFGPPAQVAGAGSGYDQSAQYCYDAPAGYFIFTFDAAGVLDTVDFEPGTVVPAGDAWKLLSGSAAVPRLELQPRESLNRAVSPSGGQTAFSVGLAGRTPGKQPFAFSASSDAPPWTGTPTFNVATNSMGIGTMAPNPAFRWDVADVKKVDVGTYNFRGDVMAERMAAASVQAPPPTFGLPLGPVNTAGW